MGTDNIFKREKERKRLQRTTGTRKIKNSILIVCEGEQTEPNYFRGFRLPNVKMETSCGGDGLAVVQKAIEVYDRKIHDKVFCVFDRDAKPDFSNATRFNEAFQRAKENNFKCIYSNEAFELWYILHFDYMQSAKSRTEYSDMLTARLGYKYKKNLSAIYADLLSRQEVAITNAKNLLKSYQPKHNPEKDNPSTNIFELVEELNKYI